MSSSSGKSAEVISPNLDCADSYGVERQVHELLREDRTPGREFFRVGQAQAVESIQSVAVAPQSTPAAIGKDQQ